MRPKPRRCGGTPARSSPSHRTVPWSSGSSPAIARSSVDFPLRSARARATISRSSTVRSTPSSAAWSPKHTVALSTVEHQKSPRSPTRTRSITSTHTTVSAIRIVAIAIACAEVRRARAAEQPEDRDGQRRRVGPHDEHGRAELAERDREREAGADGERRGRRSAGRPRATRASATRRARRPPRAAGGRSRGAPGTTERTTNGIATSACAIGTRIASTAGRAAARRAR